MWRLLACARRGWRCLMHRGAWAAVNCMSADTERTSEHGSLPDSQPVIEFRHAGYRLADGRALLRDLSLVVQRGETLVLLGRSGAGKTTALKMINRLLEPSEGAVLVDGARRWSGIRSRCGGASGT